MNFDWHYFVNTFPKLVKYIPMTLLLAILSMLLAIVLGGIITLLHFSHYKVIHWFASIYVSFFRGMPALVQLFLIYYGLPQIFPIFKGLPAIIATVIGLGFKQSAYLSEVFRAAVNSVDRGQIEAGQSLNIKSFKIFRYVILPQAFINALPATGNTFVGLLKETSLAFTLGITEVFAEGKMLAGDSFKYFETYLAVGLTYWVLIILYSWAQSGVERVLNTPYS
ncbi:amino acid ABC transporter permease [Leuconostoc mesenteroides]|uniref:amino acid ABC transporter permease n=1 Tax=Leuconostoc mesenteroides TaxID=1245 RepID=UPI001CBB01F0|nr:amino acid ABC transporter permease [Leuconostoc mesenteroides]MBZ1526621.1 amino acid ABC transporter permease [Leuconostoc mesenteroides]